MKLISSIFCLKSHNYESWPIYVIRHELQIPKFWRIFKSNYISFLYAFSHEGFSMLNKYSELLYSVHTREPFIVGSHFSYCVFCNKFQSCDWAEYYVRRNFFQYFCNQINHKYHNIHINEKKTGLRQEAFRMSWISDF